MDSSTLLKIGLTLLYIIITLYLGYKGWRETKDGKDYLIAGRSMGSFVMSMSYGATFISTSAIIGFGGAAALFGFPLLWLTVLNIFVGIFVAMVVLGRRIRRLGLAVDAHTFPELIGRRYNSPFLQGFAGLVIFLFLPIYAGAVLIGLARLVEVIFSIPYSTALLLCTFIVALYVLTGGLKAVMYTDAFQGCVMFVVMVDFPDRHVLSCRWLHVCSSGADRYGAVLSRRSQGSGDVGMDPGSHILEPGMADRVHDHCPRSGHRSARATAAFGSTDDSADRRPVEACGFVRRSIYFVHDRCSLRGRRPHQRDLLQGPGAHDGRG